MHILWQLLLFLGQSVIVALVVLIIIAGILALVSHGKNTQKPDRIVIKPLNQSLATVKHAIQQQSLSKAAFKKWHKASKARDQKADKPRLFVLDFSGDVRASQVQQLARLVSAIILTYQQGDEVLLRLESPGGIVNGYGLAASQLTRLTEANIPLTIAVDKVAASGGYMMACVADYLIAAPFAIIGSIGVVAQIPNFNQWLKKHDIAYEQITAGEYKRTLTLFGENTKEGRHKMQSDVNDTHELFKDFINSHRPQVNLREVATGEHWYAKQALALQLIDKLQTSDDYLLEKYQSFKLIALSISPKKSLAKKLSQGVQLLLNDFKAWIKQG